jgi:hypothetical protein
MSRTQRNLARVLAVCIGFAGAPIPAVHAELVATDQIEASAQARPHGRAFVNALLDRADVRAALERQGVRPEDAKARVAAMSDREVEGLAQKIDSLPAGAGGVEAVLWVAFLVFLILLITDILGFTKVFPFTRPAK